MTVAVPLVKNVIAPLALMESVFAQDGALQRKMRGRGVATAGIALVTQNEDMEDIIRIMKLLEHLAVLIETVKHEMKNKAVDFWHIIRNFGCISISQYQEEL